MRCPDEKQLMLYVDGEVSLAEADEIKRHLLTCKHCQNEVEAFKKELETESVLKNRVSSNIARRNLKAKIMAKVAVEPRPTPVYSKKNTWVGWLAKFLLPSMAIALIVGLLYTSGYVSTYETAENFVGKTYRVSLFTSSAACFLDGVEIQPNKCIDLELNKINKLDGSFLLNVVGSEQVFSLQINGCTNLSIKDGMKPVFSDCLADIVLLNGNLVLAEVNGKEEKLNKRKPISLQPKGKGAAKASLSEVKKAGKKAVEAEALPADRATNPVDPASSTEEVVSSSQLASEDEDEIEWETSGATVPDELTINSTGAISIIDSATEFELEEARSPFSEKQIGGY